MTQLDDPAVKVVVERPCRGCFARWLLRLGVCPVCDGAGVEYVSVRGSGHAGAHPMPVEVPA